MKTHLIVISGLILLCLSARKVSLQKSADSISAASVYEGSTPCSKGKNLLPAIPSTDDCEYMKWHLTLFYVHDNLHSSTYKLTCQYKGPGTAKFKTVEMKGSWVVTKGAKMNPTAAVYELSIDRGPNVLLIRLSDDLLHLLDTDRQMMIGNPGWSYTLNRVKN